MTGIRRWRAPLQKGSGMGSATWLLNARPADFQRIVLLCWSSVISVVGRVRIRLGKKPSSDIFAVVLAGMTLLLNGCGDNGIMSRFMLKPDRIIVEGRPDLVYDQLFPYYVEL